MSYFPDYLIYTKTVHGLQITLFSNNNNNNNIVRFCTFHFFFISDLFVLFWAYFYSSISFRFEYKLLQEEKTANQWCSNLKQNEKKNCIFVHDWGTPGSCILHTEHNGARFASLASLFPTVDVKRMKQDWETGIEEQSNRNNKSGETNVDSCFEHFPFAKLCPMYILHILNLEATIKKYLKNYRILTVFSNVMNVKKFIC